MMNAYLTETRILWAWPKKHPNVCLVAIQYHDNSYAIFLQRGTGLVAIVPNKNMKEEFVNKMQNARKLLDTFYFKS